jgi:hypothetical protein
LTTKPRKKASKAPAPLSLRAYAKRRGVSPEAVSKAVESGRLRESVVLVGGVPKIGDPDLADREWDARTRPRVDQRPARPRGADPAPNQQAEPCDPVGPAPDAGPVPDYFVSRVLREAAAARREAALAVLAELDVAVRQGELVPVAEARQAVIDKFSIVRTRILGVPLRVAQRVPHVSPATSRGA